jgi:signal transduction histidine kinase
MRAALVTLFPMLVAAVLVMVGGERMARREVETRTPFDRPRLLDLDEAFRAELSRLDAVYSEHLSDLAIVALSDKPDSVAAGALRISGVRLVRVFRKNGKNLNILPDWKLSNLPEIELSNGKRPLNSETAVVLAASMLEEPLPSKGKWIGTTDAAYLVHCRQPEPDTLTVFLIERAIVSERIASHLRTWLESPLTPIRETGGRLLIDQPKAGDPFIALGSEQHGPAASVIPIRTIFGDWQIRTWDGLVVTLSHDPTILALAATLAALLTGSGVVLMLQQKRALKLAAERVSFVNRVSHEFGAPLTNLSLNLDLATDFLTSRPEEARRRLGLVAEEIERLSRLVANVLTFSRRERDALELKPVSCIPEEVIQRVIEGFRPSLERRGISIEAEFSASEPVWIDPDALSQITGNLLSNVEKYAATGSWLGLQCRVVSGFLTLEVRDRGEGIPAAARQRVFVPFERVLQTTNEGASGTGLGLSIARDLARRMGGDLELLDSDVGTCFRLHVPTPPELTLISNPDAA